MKIADADKIISEGISNAHTFLQIWKDQPKDSPLRKEMQDAIIKSLSWANNDEIIDAIYDADMRAMEDKC